jgi:hypothetical protein
MKHLFKSIFKPLSNRNYADKRTSALIYALEFLPLILFCVYGAIAINALFILLLVPVIVFGFFKYLFFDSVLDRLSWKLIWSHFYHDEIHPSDSEHKAMKNYETKPTAKNYKKLEKHLDKDSSNIKN